MKKLFLLLLICLLPVSSWASSAGMLPVGGVTVVVAGGGGGQNFSDAFPTDPFTTRWTNLTTANTYVWANSLGTGSIYPDSAGGAACYYNTSTTTVNQYVKFTVPSGDAGGYGGIAFRSTGTGSAGFYGIEIYNNEIYLSKWSDAGWVSDIEDLGPMTLATTNSVGMTVCGDGSATRFHVWLNPTGNSPTTCISWGGASPGASSTGDPGSPYYIGKKAGFASQGDHAQDDAYIGDVP